MQTLASMLGRGAGAQPEILEERLGGTPWGLDPGLWPRCAECGRSQSLLGQFKHHSDRLDLGRDGRMLFVFQCDHEPGMCDTWEAFSGANSCLIVEPEDLTGTSTPTPNDSPPTTNEVRIVNWLSKDDGLDESLKPAFFSEEGMDRLGEEIWQAVPEGTRLGSVPFWIQSPDEAPKDGWRFVGQMADSYQFLRAPVSRPKWVREERGAAGLRYWGVGPNFGDCGIAYVFLKDDGDLPRACMFWQCS